MSRHGKVEPGAREEARRRGQATRLLRRAGPSQGCDGCAHQHLGGAECSVKDKRECYEPAEGQRKTLEPGSRAWEREANRLARDFCPRIYACRKCGYPVVSGYSCTGCRTGSPETP